VDFKVVRSIPGIIVERRAVCEFGRFEWKPPQNKHLHFLTRFGTRIALNRA
jgi:hypothetical protein